MNKKKLLKNFVAMGIGVVAVLIPLLFWSAVARYAPMWLPGSSETWNFWCLVFAGCSCFMMGAVHTVWLICYVGDDLWW